MSTWDDKPNDYEHALVIIDRLRTELERLRAELAAERERCARVAETWDGTAIGPRHVACDIADAIRRGDGKKTGNPDEGLPTAEDVRGILK